MSPILGCEEFWSGGQYGRRRIDRGGPLRRGDPSGNYFRRRRSDDQQALDQVSCPTRRSRRTGVVERRLRDRRRVDHDKVELNKLPGCESAAIMLRPAKPSRGYVEDNDIRLSLNG